MSEVSSVQISADNAQSSLGNSNATQPKTRKGKKSKKSRLKISWEEDRWLYYDQMKSNREEANFNWNLATTLGIEFQDSEEVCKSKLEQFGMQDLKAKR
ncbi:hypothetical protein ACS0TY_007354 [Phlomoides rotata]